MVAPRQGESEFPRIEMTEEFFAWVADRLAEDARKMVGHSRNAVVTTTLPQVAFANLLINELINEVRRLRQEVRQGEVKDPEKP